MDVPVSADLEFTLQGENLPLAIARKALLVKSILTRGQSLKTGVQSPPTPLIYLYLVGANLRAQRGLVCYLGSHSVLIQPTLQLLVKGSKFQAAVTTTITINCHHLRVNGTVRSSSHFHNLPLS